MISSGSDFMRDVYLTSNKARLQKYLIIKHSEKGHLLDIAKWLRMRRKCPGRDLLLTTCLLHRHGIAGNAAVAVVAGWGICHGAACRGGVMKYRLRWSDIFMSRGFIRRYITFMTVTESQLQLQLRVSAARRNSYPAQYIPLQPRPRKRTPVPAGTGQRDHHQV